MATTQWALDPTHSELQFKVKHLMITTVTGSLNIFSATVTSEGDDFENGQISFEAEAGSIDTGNKDRDNHLTSADFFDAAQFPAITFKSTSFTKDGDGYELKGD